MANKKDKLDGITRMLQEQKEKKGLSAQEYMLFKQLNLDCFQEDLKNNIYLTSIDLAEKYSDDDNLTSVDDWKDFLGYAPIKRFISDMRDEITSAKAHKALSTGDMKSSDALKAQKMLDDKRAGGENSNIVVVFMPPKQKEGL